MTSSASAPGDVERAPRGHWPATWALSLGFFLVAIDGSIVVLATPDLMADLGVGTDLALWVTSVYLLCSAGPLLLFGRLGDRIGRGRVYLFGLIGFVVASVACGLAPTIEVLIVARAVQGLAAAAMAPQSLAIIRDITPPERLGAAMGLWGSVSGLANVLGPLIGGVLVGVAGWRWVFLINLPIGLIPLALALRYVPLGRAVRRVRVDAWGALLSIVAIVLLIYGIQQGAALVAAGAWGAAAAAAVVGSGLVALLAFVAVERRRGDAAILPPAVFRMPGFVGGSVGVAMVAMIVTAVPIPLALAAQNALGLSPLASALVQLPIGVGAAALAPVTGRIIDRVGPRPIALAGLLAYVATGSAIGLSIASRSVWLMVAATTVFGIANAMVWASLSVLAMAGMPSRIAGPASASYNAFRQFGAVLGAAGVAALVQVGLLWRFRDDRTGLADAAVGVVRPESVADYTGAMSFAAVAVSLVGLVAVVVLAVTGRRASRRAA